MIRLPSNEVPADRSSPPAAHLGDRAGLFLALLEEGFDLFAEAIAQLDEAQTEPTEEPNE